MLHRNIFTAKTCLRIVQKKPGEKIQLPSRLLKAALLSPQCSGRNLSKEIAGLKAEVELVAEEARELAGEVPF